MAPFDPKAAVSFNIGRNGSQTDMQLAVLKAYLRHNQKPEMIIHNLDSFSFVTTKEVYDPAQYLPYLNEPDIYRALHEIDPDVWWKSKYLPLYGYVVEDMRFNWLAGVKGLFGWSPAQDFFQGYNPRWGQWAEEFASFKAANTQGVTFAIDPAGVRLIEELIDLCKQNGIRLMLVYSPEYREMQPLTKNRAEIFARFRELADRNGIPFWDFSNWEYSDRTEFFRNSQHLNAEGAEKFSTDLAARLATALPPAANLARH